MPRGVRLTILDRGSGERSQRDFPRFPVRIGRNDLNDLHLGGQAVSQFHALVELSEGRVALRDLGSKNGTAVAGIGRLKANVLTDISEFHNEFYVAQYFIRAEFMDVPAESLSAAAQNRARAEKTGFSAISVLQEQQNAEQQARAVEHGAHGHSAPPPAHPPQHDPRMAQQAMGGAPPPQHATSATAQAGPQPGQPMPQRPAPVHRPQPDDDDPEPPSGKTMPHGSALTIRFKPLYEEYRNSWSKLFATLESSVGHLDEELRKNACAELSQAFPGLANEPDFKAFADPIPVEEGTVISQKATLTRATIALNGLQRLAAVYLPHDHELDSPQEVAVFLDKVFEVLDVFLRCFIPMRDGYKAFTTQLELSKARDQYPPRGGVSVDNASTTTELGAALLEWKRPPDPDQPQPSQTVEWVFADLMIHHMAMITGVMQGVKSLLGELAPATIERSFDDPKRNAGGLQIGPFRYKQLWELYAMRHSDLADEDKETFALIFGGDFARAYSQLAADTQATQAIRISTQYPTRTPSPVRGPGPGKPQR